MFARNGSKKGNTKIKKKICIYNPKIKNKKKKLVGREDEIVKK